MKKIFLLFSLVLSTLIVASPTLYGPSGLVTIPTAEALKYKEFNLSVDNLWSKTNEDYDDWIYKVNLGTFENWEFGIVGGQVPTEGVFLNVKYYLMSDNSTQPLSFAIGSEKLTSTSDTSIYMVASKKFRPDLGFHFGFRAIFGEEALDPSFMTGVNYVFSDILEFMTDVNGQEDKYTVNASVQLYIIRDLAIRATITDLGQLYKTSSDDIEGIGTQLGLGFTYTKFL